MQHNEVTRYVLSLDMVNPSCGCLLHGHLTTCCRIVEEHEETLTEAIQSGRMRKGGAMAA